MKKFPYIITAALVAMLSFTACDDAGGDDGDADHHDGETAEVASVGEIIYTMPGEAEKTIGEAEGEAEEENGNTKIELESDDTELEIYISSKLEDIKAMTYPVATDGNGGANMVVSYALELPDDRKSNCCGKMMDKTSMGSLTVTEVNEHMISGNYDITSYDDVRVRGSFTVKKDD